MPYGAVDGMQSGSLVERIGQSLTIPAGMAMLGRVVDENGMPVDGKGPVLCHSRQLVQNAPPHPMQRKPINEVMRTGIRSIDALNTVGTGQRIGLFAGAGVGKSVLLGMIAKHSSAEVNVIRLIGERGREVQEFIDET